MARVSGTGARQSEFWRHQFGGRSYRTMLHRQMARKRQRINEGRNKADQVEAKLAKKQTESKQQLMKTNEN